MERLTKRDVFGNADIIGVDSQDLQGNLDFEGFNKVTNALNKLATYETLEEQGLLLRLPCKVGDTVYFTCRRYDRKNNVFVPLVHSGYVKAIKLSARPLKITVEYEDLDDCGRCKGSDYHASNIGKTVFLTKEEAEAKLREMEVGE